MTEMCAMRAETGSAFTVVKATDPRQGLCSRESASPRDDSFSERTLELPSLDTTEPRAYLFRNVRNVSA